MENRKTVCRDAKQYAAAPGTDEQKLAETRPEKTEPAQPKEKEGEKPSSEKNIAERKAEFEKLIRGEYKDLYEEKIKEHLSKRFRENDSLKKRLAEADEILEVIADRYGIEAGDIKSLKSAVNNDDELFENEAKKYGIEVGSYRYMKNLERENERTKRQLNQSRMKSEMAEKMRRWYGDSQNAAQEYPDFDINREIENPKFVELIRNGVDIKTAYEVVHHSDIIDRIKSDTAAQAKKEAAKELEARNRRPVENGLSSQSSAIYKKDAAKLTPQEREEIARRVARGEHITF